MTTLNGLYPLSHLKKDFPNENKDKFTIEKSKFDPQTMRDISKIRYEDDSGNKKEITTDERYYLPEEIEKLLQSLNFKSIAIFGCECGNFNKGREITPDNYEMLVIAEK
jgi:hypothetical protein